MKKHINLLLAVFLMAGCETERYYSDAQHPEIELMMDGRVTYRRRYVDVEDLPRLLRDSGLTRHDTINIRCAPEVQNDWRNQRRVMSVLSRNGYTRPMIVGTRESSAKLGLTREEKRRAEKQRQMKHREPTSPTIRPKMRY